MPHLHKALAVGCKFMGRLVKLILLLFAFSFNTFGQSKVDSNAAKVFSLIIQENRNVFLNTGIDSATLLYLKLRFFDSAKQCQQANSRSKETAELCITDSEKRTIDSCFSANLTYEWTNTKLASVGLLQFKLVRGNTRRQVFKYGDDTYRIMKPIFFRNYSVCIFYFDITCPGLCGLGSLLVLKKDKGKWRLWKKIYDYHR